MAPKTLLLSFLSFLFTFFTVGLSQDDCYYSVYVVTANYRNAGTNSTISMTIFNELDDSVSVSDLTEWGMESPHHVYFQEGQVDRFMGKGPCLKKPVCGITIKTDGIGNSPFWILQEAAVFGYGPGPKGKAGTGCVWYDERILLTPNAPTVTHSERCKAPSPTPLPPTSPPPPSARKYIQLKHYDQ